MCCEPRGAECTDKAWKARVECPDCGAYCQKDDDEYISFDICGYSATQCETCGDAPCNQAC